VDSVDTEDSPFRARAIPWGAMFPGCLISSVVLVVIQWIPSWERFAWIVSTGLVLGAAVAAIALAARMYRYAQRNFGFIVRWLVTLFGVSALSLVLCIGTLLVLLAASFAGGFRREVQLPQFHTTLYFYDISDSDRKTAVYQRHSWLPLRESSFVLVGRPDEIEVVESASGVSLNGRALVLTKPLNH
jgi:hypothetical protein